MRSPWMTPSRWTEAYRPEGNWALQRPPTPVVYGKLRTESPNAEHDPRKEAMQEGPRDARYIVHHRHETEHPPRQDDNGPDSRGRPYSEGEPFQIPSYSGPPSGKAHKLKAAKRGVDLLAADGVNACDVWHTDGGIEGNRRHCVSPVLGNLWGGQLHPCGSSKSALKRRPASAAPQARPRGSCSFQPSGPQPSSLSPYAKNPTATATQAVTLCSIPQPPSWSPYAGIDGTKLLQGEVTLDWGAEKGQDDNSLSPQGRALSPEWSPQAIALTPPCRGQSGTDEGGQGGEGLQSRRISLQERIDVAAERKSRQSSNKHLVGQKDSEAAAAREYRRIFCSTYKLHAGVPFRLEGVKPSQASSAERKPRRASATHLELSPNLDLTSHLNSRSPTPKGITKIATGSDHEILSPRKENANIPKLTLRRPGTAVLRWKERQAARLSQ